MQTVDAIIVGGGPCGLSAAIELQNIGLKPIVIEKGNVVNALYNYPTHQTFFSTSEKLAIGDVPFIIEERKPRRNQALVYYREVVKMKNIQVNRFEKVESVVKKQDGAFEVQTDKAIYSTPYVIVATGYYDQPNYMNIPGEDLPKVYHYFKEAHPFFDTDVLVIGGKNSAVDAALELNKAGARVTVVYRGSEYSPSIKPWILPEFVALVRNEEITMHFNSHVKEIREKEVVVEINGEESTIKNDFVFAMTGYHPDHGFIRAMGVNIDEETGRPTYDLETMETNVENLYIAGVLAAGNNANEIFIENGKFHGGFIAADILKKMK
ncbi:YpdA family putative bacillithiol disulfide reductase [Lysinibacillus endophyticus]|uniref:YpdA family putative bacillithiol disulfide reductase n=1 Tax=Ureibacillus endophyticus TaxID=1978490 RepID=A0A494Z0Y1_9BACL|nr:YpdA family putative bacillithiol disulfide reductase [Lysinibacillus endophyticus]MCP1144256.1 YpdA family putative bacillithiol disulfide reductase [Lysinibacillus endophyticus]RKQ16187.1 YpdA family putative bacillithiol disulfide reductase [Lysinibacillus endophyticus]